MEGAEIVCTAEVQECPDGTSVGRDPLNNCEFLPCAEEPEKTGEQEPEKTGEQEPEKTDKECPGTTPEGEPSLCEELPEAEANTAGKKCGKGTSRFGGYCACWSGAYGKNCTMDSAVPRKIIRTPWKLVNLADYRDLDHAYQSEVNFEMDFTGHTCTSFIEVKFLQTLAPPILDRAQFRDGKLEMSVSHPIVNGRAESVVYLNKNHSNKDCIYPTSDYITKKLSGCKDVFDFSVPWNLASKCSWEIYREETHVVYCGIVVLQHTEWMENIKEWRFTQSMLRIKIRFQLFVKIEVGSVVVNKPEITAAITKQLVNIDCYDILPALIELTTLINWPYKLRTDFELTLTPAGKVASHELDFTDCSGSENSECRQKWRTGLTLTESTCTLDGNYQLSYTQICSPGFGECPLRESDSKVVIDYSLTSENFCAEVSIDIALTATIKIFEDAEFKKPRSLFLVGQRAYFLITVSSNLNSEANIIDFSNLKILNVLVRGEKSDLPTLICEKGLPTNDTVNVNIEIHQGSNSREVGFSFDFTSELTNILLVPNGKRSFVTSAEIEAGYSNKKRLAFEVFAEGKEKSTFSTEVEVDDGKNPQYDSSFVLVTSLLLMIVALFI
jgi:hypothetical protein